MTSNKHAYLIIAHNEFEVLQYLIHCIDDVRNDIFIHFDKKVTHIPKLSVSYANLIILDNRYDVRWGHFSQLEAEFSLFAKANATGKYIYYHLLSGVHMPLYSQNYLHDFYKKQAPNSFFMKMPTSSREINMKMRYYHFFIKNFMHKNPICKRFNQLCWHLVLKFQQVFGLQRNKGGRFDKASQWNSLHSSAIDYLLYNKDDILRRYKFTFCADEFFILSELNRSKLKIDLVNYPNLLKCDFVGTSPRIYTISDYEDLYSSNCLFARKFDKINLDVVIRISENLK